MTAPSDGEYARRVRLHLYHVDPDGIGRFDDQAWLGWVRAGMTTASRYGLTTEAQVLRYLYANWVFGPDYDERLPWASRLLNARTQDADDRAARLLELTDAAVRERGPDAPVMPR